MVAKWFLGLLDQAEQKAGRKYLPFWETFRSRLKCDLATYEATYGTVDVSPLLRLISATTLTQEQVAWGQPLLNRMQGRYGTPTADLSNFLDHVAWKYEDGY